MPHLLFLPEGPSGKQSCGSFPKRKRGADQSLLSLRCPARGEHERRRTALQVQRPSLGRDQREQGIGPQVRPRLVRPWGKAQ